MPVQQLEIWEAGSLKKQVPFIQFISTPNISNIVVIGTEISTVLTQLEQKAGMRQEHVGRLDEQPLPFQINLYNALSGCHWNFKHANPEIIVLIHGRQL